MKTFRSFFLCLATPLACMHLHAQPAGWQSQVNRIQNQQFQQMRLLQNLNRYSYNYKSGYLVNIKYDFFVVMRDSSQLKVKSKIHSDTVRHINFLVYEDKSLSKSDSDR